MNLDLLIESAKSKSLEPVYDLTLCSECGHFYANWYLKSKDKYYCATCVEKVTMEDLG